MKGSDFFDPTSQLSAHTPETNVRGTLELGHAAMVSRYTANLFFAMTDLGRICFDHLLDSMVSDIDGSKFTSITADMRDLLLC